MQSVRIAVDAMGGDGAPSVNILGALQALDADPDLCVILVGPRETVVAELTKKHARETDRLSIVHCEEVISMEDHAATAARRKKESGMHVGMRLIKDSKAEAFLSAGNSGAVMTTALLELGRLSDVERPAIVVRLPTAEGSVILLDVGANVDCRPTQLVQFAKMGDFFARAINAVAKPRVGLLSNGGEAHKGNELTRQTHDLLRQEKDIHYTGYVEGFDLFRGAVDVVVCDGFVGNVTLKVSEGLAETAFRWFKQQVRSDWMALMGVFFLKRVLKKFRRKFDYQPYGAAPLLGINGLVLISHGSSTPTAICNGILTAKKGVESDFIRKMSQVMNVGVAQ